MRWRTGNRSGAVRVPLPHPIGWTILTLLIAAAAGYFLLVGWKTVAGPAEPRWLTVVLARGEVTQAAAALLAVLGLLSVRRALFARLARKPGPVEIASFAGASAGSPPAEDVLAEFRRTLTSMSLSTPQAVPSAPAADTLLDDVKTAVDSSNNAVATVAALIKAVTQVRHAYRVSALMRDGGASGNGPCGITVHVVTLPSGRGEIGTFWSADWADVAAQAAHFVGAFVLVRSHLARRPPWTGWQGLDMPPDLFRHSQLARGHVRARQYEKAMAEFHMALKHDPQNPYLRIELAQVQEQLGLFMDALLTYADVVAIEAWFDRRLWLRLRRLFGDQSDGYPPSRLDRSPHGREALLIARYRMVCRLAAADQLAGQWESVRRQSDAMLLEGQGGDNRRRALERHLLRSRLIVWLSGYAGEYGERYGDDAKIESYSHTRIRHFLQHVAYTEAMHMVHDYRWTQGRRRPGMPVTQTALRLMRVWAPLYVDYATSRLTPDERARSGEPVDWPRNAEKLAAQVSAVIGRKPPNLREWQEYYNAACTFAVALGDTMTGSAEDSNGRGLAESAVRNLERAVSRTDSGYVGRYAQWISTGDQDLNRLRSTDQFVLFLDRYLPNDERRVGRPSKLVPLIMSRHVMAIVQRYALLRADYWESQLRLGRRAEASAVWDELDRESGIRAAVREFADDYQDWRVRLTLIEETEDFTRRRHLPDPGSALPQFQDDPAVKRYALEGTTIVGGRSVGYPDDYYAEVVRKRDALWPDMRDRVPTTSVRAAVPPSGVLTAAMVAAMAVWHDVDVMLRGALEGSDAAPEKDRTAGLVLPVRGAVPT